MSQRPSAVGLMLCDQVVFEEGTHKPYLLGVFIGVAVDDFPTGPQRFDLFVALTDGLGEVTINVKVVRMENDEEIYSRSMNVRFANPLQIVNLRFQVRHLIYPTPGTYLVSFEADGEEIAARRVRVYQLGEPP
jgi:hypothetical protein